MSHLIYVWDEVKEIILKHKIKGAVLDVGARNAAMKPELESVGLKYYGIDTNPMSKEVIRGNMNNLLIEKNLGLFPEVDLVFFCHSFEHNELPCVALRQAWHVLKRGGYLIIASPYPCKHQIIDGDEDHIMVLNDMQMTKLLNYTGFGDVNCFVSKIARREQDYNIISIGRKT